MDRDSVRMTLPSIEPAEARRMLGIERLVLEIHDASFPGVEHEDVGRGSPGSEAAGDLFRLLVTLGFDGIQLGPQGETSDGNPSPYDARLFRRDSRSIALSPLVEAGQLSRATLARLTAGRPAGSLTMAAPEYAHAAISQALDEAFPRDLMSRHERAEWLLDAQHRRVRALHPRLRWIGDLQIGMSPEDTLRFQDLFLPGFCMGAPPSRTNPEGQPWGYPVFDPRRRPAVLELMRARVRRMLAEDDAVRIDHPHGLVCRWVYRPGQPVADGARLFAAPDDPDLAPFAIARPDQIDRRRARHADEWERDLDEDQIARYAEIIDLIVDEVVADGGQKSDIVCEVLSTMPHPLARVLARHGLGRFRVLQKLSLTDPADVYRIEHARPEDWIMVGNHDTASIWSLIEEWRGGPQWKAWGSYLAGLLGRIVDADVLCADPREMVHALFAAIFASPARNVLVCFTDLFGLTERYNLPGTTSPANWRLRVPPDFRARLASGGGLDVARALAMAVASRHSRAR